MKNQQDIEEWRKEVADVKPLFNALLPEVTLEVDSSNVDCQKLGDKTSAPRKNKGNSFVQARENIGIVQMKVRYPNYEREIPTVRLSKIDNSMMRQLRLQRLHISYMIDLHDMSLSYAYDELHRFLQQAWQAQTKIALVITGKGSRNRNKWAQEEGDNNDKAIGELRRNLPRWCIEPNFQPMVVAISHAYPHHGGQGAFYVQIRSRV